MVRCQILTAAFQVSRYTELGHVRGCVGYNLVLHAIHVAIFGAIGNMFTTPKGPHPWCQVMRSQRPEYESRASSGLSTGGQEQPTLLLLILFFAMQSRLLQVKRGAGNSWRTIPRTSGNCARAAYCLPAPLMRTNRPRARGASQPQGNLSQPCSCATSRHVWTDSMRWLILNFLM